MIDPIRRRQILLQSYGLYAGRIDGIDGPLTKAAMARYVAEKPTILHGSGRWLWPAAIDKGDIIVANARGTCFGGDSDPQDNGDTASGISTKPPGVLGVALPLDGRSFPGMSDAEHDALDGSPLPQIPWGVMVIVTRISDGVSHPLPLIDLGPGIRTGNKIDLTPAAAKLFDPHASATNFEILCRYRIVAAAKFAIP